MQMVTILYQHGLRHGVSNIYQLLEPCLGPPEPGVVVGRMGFFFEVTPHNALFFSASSKYLKTVIPLFLNMTYFSFNNNCIYSVFET